MLKAIESIHLVGEEFNDPGRGSLTVATTHTHARYVLADVIRKFAKRYPAVSVKIMQGLPNQIADWVRTGEATIGLATHPAGDNSDLAFVDCYEVHHTLIVPQKHALLELRQLTLADLAQYPLISYDDGYQIARKLLAKFADAGLTPNIVMRASDSDVIKTYVAAGLGVAVIPTLAFNQSKDRSIRARSLGKVLEPTVACAILRPGVPPRSFMVDFLRLVSPTVTEAAIVAAVVT